MYPNHPLLHTHKHIHPCTPSTPQVLDALIGSGLVPALLKAVQLLAAAHRQGHLRLAALTAYESTATAHTYGAAFVTTLRWLAELRCVLWVDWAGRDACGHSSCVCGQAGRAAEQAAGCVLCCRALDACLPPHSTVLPPPTHPPVHPHCREAPPAAAMPLAFAAGAGLGLGQVLQPVSLLLTRGKHCRGDQSYAPIQASLQNCFEAFSAPVAAKLTPQGLLLHADAFALTAWLAMPSAAALLSPLSAAAAGGGSSGGGSANSATLSGALLADDVAADMQCSKAFAAVLEFEAGHGVSGDALAASPHAASLRQALVGHIVTVAARLGVQVCGPEGALCG